MQFPDKLNVFQLPEMTNVFDESSLIGADVKFLEIGEILVTLETLDAIVFQLEQLQVDQLQQHHAIL
jgi:hypothetical protein